MPSIHPLCPSIHPLAHRIAQALGPLRPSDRSGPRSIPMPVLAAPHRSGPSTAQDLVALVLDGSGPRPPEIPRFGLDRGIDPSL